MLYTGNDRTGVIMRYCSFFIIWCLLFACYQPSGAEEEGEVLLKLSSTPKTKEEVTVWVEVLQVLPESGGMLCTTWDGTIFIEYSPHDLADGDIIRIKVKRDGHYTYLTRLGNARRIGKYKWVPREGQTQILPAEGELERITGSVIEISETGIKVWDWDEQRGAVILGHPEEDNLVEGDEISCMVRRTGTFTFINVRNTRRTNPVYQFISG